MRTMAVIAAETKTAASHLQNALWSWKGDPNNAHITDVLQGVPNPYPGSKSSQDMRAQAEALVGAVKGAGPVNKTLYRGMIVKADPSLLKTYAVGATVKLAPTGFTEDKQIAYRNFSNMFDRRIGEVAIRITLQSGASALRIADHAESMIDGFEKEYIVGGSFQVTDLKTEGPIINVSMRQVRGL